MVDETAAIAAAIVEEMAAAVSAIVLQQRLQKWTKSLQQCCTSGRNGRNRGRTGDSNGGDSGCNGEMPRRGGFYPL